MADRGRRPRGPRLPHLDHLRAVLVAWVIGGHALVGYSAVGGWAYDEVNEVTFAPATELVLVAVIGPSGLFIIGVLFFIAGLLVEQAVERHGWSRYTRERVVRLGLPWLVSAVLVWPASVWLAYVAAGRQVSFWWVLTHRDPLLDSGALWFALVLLVFSAAFALARPWTVGRRGRPARTLTGRHVAATVALVALSSFVVRLWFPARSGQVGDLHLWQWPQCLGLFVLGIAAARSGWHWHVPGRLRRRCGAVALVTLVLLPVLALASGVRDLSRDVASYLGGWHWESLATAGIEGILVVTGSVWLVGLAERRWRDRAPETAGWARGAFAAFVIQGPVLMVLASAARPLDLPAELKAPLVAALGITACFWLGRRLPILSGRRPAAAGGSTADPGPGGTR